MSFLLKAHEAFKMSMQKRQNIILFFSCANNQKDKSISFETPDGMVWVEGKS